MRRVAGAFGLNAAAKVACCNGDMAASNANAALLGWAARPVRLAVGNSSNQAEFTRSGHSAWWQPDLLTDCLGAHVVRFPGTGGWQTVEDMSATTQPGIVVPSLIFRAHICANCRHLVLESSVDFAVCAFACASAPRQRLDEDRFATRRSRLGAQPPFRMHRERAWESPSS